jgi:asparagine synthetase B (glutamine-hydrolysing)
LAEGSIAGIVGLRSGSSLQTATELLSRADSGTLEVTVAGAEFAVVPYSPGGGFCGDIAGFLCAFIGVLWWGDSDAVLQGKEAAEFLLDAIERNVSLEDLGGYFSFASYFAPERRLTLMTDPAGSQNLCYAEVADTGLVFGSSALGLARYQGVSREPDKATFIEYLLCLPRRPERTYFERIRKVRRASILTWDNQGISIRRYWHLLKIGEPIRKPVDTSEILSCLGRAVRRSATGSCSLGVALSGGVDSSAIVGILSRLGTQSIAVSATFKEDELADETPEIELLAKALNVRVEWLRTEGLSANMQKTIGRCDEPNSAVFAPFGLALANRANQVGIDCLLTGGQGDRVNGKTRMRQVELAHGKSWRELLDVVDPTPHSRTIMMRLLLALRLRLLDQSKWFREDNCAREPLNRLVARQLTNVSLRVRLVEELAERRKQFVRYSASPPENLGVDLEQYLDYRAGSELAVMRIGSDDTGLCIRQPYLDSDYLRLSARFSLEDRQAGGFERAALRNALKGIIPEPVRLKRRKAFMDNFYRRLWSQFDGSTGAVSVPEWMGNDWGELLEYGGPDKSLSWFRQRLKICAEWVRVNAG